MILPYERIDQEQIAKAFRCNKEEFVISRGPFRWMRDNQVISNAYEMFCLETVCEERGWEIVAQFGESIAIVKEK